MPSRVCGWASTANMIVSEAVAVGDFPVEESAGIG